MENIAAVTLWLAATGLLLLLWARFVEPRWLARETVEVPIPDLPAPLDGFRVTVLSDFHYPRYSDSRLIRRAIGLSNAVCPDVVVLAGDLCDRARGEPKIVPFLGEVLAGIESRYGVYAVLGNHDHWLNADGIRREIARSTPIRLVENDAVLLDVQGAALAIAGVGDLMTGVVDVKAALARVPVSVPRILISHNPDVAELTAEAVHIDLQISGHTHGGQVRIPFGPAPCVPSRYGNRYRAGLIRGPRHLVYVNRGIASMKGMRFWRRPEITLLILRRVAMFP